ncbi:MAG: ABC transporter ATP-binding protein [Planctomycetes bacterium]|nr:ABC transporter ATP-binding protein [Planctomycetota bacterium]
MSPYALEVRGLTKRFGSFVAVNGVSFQVRPGEIVGFIGPNGAGKTTTMRMCATLEMPDEGDVLIEGRSALEDPRAARRRIGFMPDSYGVYPSTTIREYLDFFARAYGLRGETRGRTVGEVIEFTKLDGLEEKLVSVLSKGMKQRLCLAKTLLHDPSVLILDEPAAGLDPRGRVELRELVKALGQLGKAVLVSSHILTELAEMCTSVVIIERGELRATGSVDEVTRRSRKRAAVFVRFLSADAPQIERALLECPGVTSVRPERGGFLFDCSGSQEELAVILQRLVDSDLRPVEFAAREANLEELFLSLTEGKVQ